MIGPLIEKAFAKLYGNYSHLIDGRKAHHAISALNGSPYEAYDVIEFSEKALWDGLVEVPNMDYPMIITTIIDESSF